eukprot:CAMPEP_0194400300 /NCGR_PEP_ID=MMETSP0174-20130528/127134_1 /TAXON_ID=216777 /ORGANISM="Proboscia alata, Strain PI-D3" /LENGTH=92 /DNA_ID=CAMNT_0039196795 /DNA_START=43 /DNA_END=321 /DNA_ORIENTATION=+
MWGAKVKTPIDLPDDILKDAITSTKSQLDTCENFESDADLIAQSLKEHMDKSWSPNWHVILGRKFGSMVTHETRRFIFFYYKEKAVMIYKAG